MTVCTIVCRYAPNDNESRLFWVQPGFIGACINLLLNGEVQITGMSLLAQNMRSCFAHVSLVAEPDYRKR